MSKENKLIEWALNSNVSAITFCQMLFNASQVLDDLIDRDKPVSSKDIISTFWNMFVAFPKNMFYREYIDDLTPVIQRSLTDWLDANELEKGSDHDKSVAFVLRDSISGILIDCAYLVGGYQHGRSVSIAIRKGIYDELLEDYMKDLGGEQ